MHSPSRIGSQNLKEVMTMTSYEREICECNFFHEQFCVTILISTSSFDSPDPDFRSSLWKDMNWCDDDRKDASEQGRLLHWKALHCLDLKTGLRENESLQKLDIMRRPSLFDFCSFVRTGSERCLRKHVIHWNKINV